MTGSIATRFGNRQNLNDLSAAVAKRLKPNTPGTSTSGGKSTLQEPFTNLGAGTAFVIDWSIGGIYRINPSADFTISFIKTPPLKFSQKVVIEVVGGAGKDITLPVDGDWGDIGSPTFSANSDLISVLMRNGETKSYWMLSFPG